MRGWSAYCAVFLARRRERQRGARGWDGLPARGWPACNMHTWHAWRWLGAARALWAKGPGHLRPLAAWQTYGCSLGSPRLQPGKPPVAASAHLRSRSNPNPNPNPSPNPNPNPNPNPSPNPTPTPTPTPNRNPQGLDAELLGLRKELSLTKLELAQASGARDEAEHKLRALVRETEAETNESMGGF